MPEAVRGNVGRALAWICLLSGSSADPWNPYPIRGPHQASVRDFGAVGDNITLDTAAVQRAIDAVGSAVLADRDATAVGYVRVPPGAYLVGTLNLTDNVYLVLETGGILQGSSDPAAYAYDWDYWHVVQAVNASNTGVIGDNLAADDLGGELRGSMCVPRGCTAVVQSLVRRAACCWPH